jgi:hypothetical protein
MSQVGSRPALVGKSITVGKGINRSERNGPLAELNSVKGDIFGIESAVN